MNRELIRRSWERYGVLLKRLENEREPLLEMTQLDEVGFNGEPMPTVDVYGESRGEKKNPVRHHFRAYRCPPWEAQLNARKRAEELEAHKEVLLVVEAYAPDLAAFVRQDALTLDGALMQIRARPVWIAFCKQIERMAFET